MKASKVTVRSAVGYIRVSTQEQGRSGLGLEAQVAAVDAFCKAGGFRQIAVSWDVESGRRDDRPGLRQALKLAKDRDATLLIAKLDRLSRNASFIMALRDSGVDFVACDLPQANTLTIGIMALLAQQEREMISTRTKAALAALKARGVKLGRPDHLTDEVRARGRAERTRRARQHANGALRQAVNYRAFGWTLQRIADELNAADATTRHGHPHSPTTVRRLLAMAAREAVYEAPDPAEAAEVARAFGSAEVQT